MDNYLEEYLDEFDLAENEKQRIRNYTKGCQYAVDFYKKIIDRLLYHCKRLYDGVEGLIDMGVLSDDFIAADALSEAKQSIEYAEGLLEQRNERD